MTDQSTPSSTSDGVPARAAGTVDLGGRAVARVGYGMMPLLRLASDDAGTASAVDLLHRAAELGVEVYDTAQFYGDGLANRLLAEAFSGSRDEVLFVTKVGARPNPGGPAPMTAAQKPEELRAAVEANLETLRTDRVDGVLMRRMDMLPGLLAEGDQRVPLLEQLDALEDMRREGLIGSIGLSHVSPEQLDAALAAGHEVAAISNFYNLIRRDDEALAERSAAVGAAWMPYFPLGGRAVLPGVASVLDDEVLQSVADETGATPNQVGLAWILAHCPTGLVISGTTSVAHLEQNVACASVRLTDEQLARLDARG
ncbi:aldo/keto reductase [Actinomyces radicidentis]|uniref:aldo/keto reductase n=1 Tax=Actinomyces radicidentis TaxID=111015 RepID=UPI0028EF8B52|nr:aldo/keto reductase [Actinomyces radicidentis]